MGWKVEGEEGEREREQEGEGESRVEEGREKFYFSSPGRCNALPSSDPFIFLSIFNLNERKGIFFFFFSFLFFLNKKKIGWKQLLSAYYSEFSRDESVMLVILSKDFQHNEVLYFLILLISVFFSLILFLFFFVFVLGGEKFCQ